MEVCIANVFSYTFNGGIEKQILELIKRLIEKKISIKFVSPMSRDDLNGKLQNVETIYTPAKKVLLPNFYPPIPIFIPILLNKIYEKKCRDIKLIHCFSEFFGPILIREKTDEQIFIHSQQNIVDMNGIYSPFKAMLNFIQKNTISKYFQDCDLIAPISGHIRSELARFHDIDEKKMKTIPNGVDCKKFRFSKKLRKDFRESHNIDNILIFVAGRMVREKGFHYLLRAVSVNTYKKDITVAIAGKGYFQEKLKYLSKKFGVEVKFLGMLEDHELIKGYCGSDIFVTPSLWPEPFGIVNIEAMACERPIIASNIGGIPEIVEDWKTGLLYNPHDINGLSEKIEIFIEDEGLRKRMGKRGRKKVEKKYNWDVLVNKWIKIYKSTINGKFQ
jgi:glycosyltransferase involved in cell wall biosynthesis